MSDCPYCQEPVEENALFCRSCGASLRLPEYDRAFCPHCGARVSARQEFCHECHWSLVKAGGKAPAEVEAAPVPSPGKPLSWRNPWVWGLAAAAGLVIALLPWIFTAGKPSPSGSGTPGPKVIAEKPVSGTPAPVPPASPAGEGAAPLEYAVSQGSMETPLGAAVLKNQLTEVLGQLRDAQLKKDITQYSQAFALNFPDLEKRRQKALAVWKIYDYSGLEFQLEEVKLLNDGHAFALVTWSLNIQQKATQAGKSEVQSYKVWFSKEGGKWRISNLEMVQKTG